MSQFVREFSRTRDAGADLSAAGNQYKIVKLNSSDQYVLAAAATDKLAGVLQNRPALGEAAHVIFGGGSSLVMAGAAITIGSPLTSDASGRAIVATAAAQRIIGFAAEAAAAAGDIIEVDINLGFMVV